MISWIGLENTKTGNNQPRRDKIPMEDWLEEVITKKKLDKSKKKTARGAIFDKDPFGVKV